MSLSIYDLSLYAFAVLVLFLTPGPVWVALLARAMSGGFRAAWPLALGVTLGDMLWPFLAILGATWVLSEFTNFLDIMRYIAAAMFFVMGVLLIKNADRTLSSDSRLTRPGMWAGFVAGVLVILGNPKAILFYMGILPGFFDLTQINNWDIFGIVMVSIVVPLVGNLVLAGFVDKIRGLLQSPTALRRVNLISGGLLILVGLAILVL